jgi:hypothetical protein
VIEIIQNDKANIFKNQKILIIERVSMDNGNRMTLISRTLPGLTQKKEHDRITA